MKLENKKNIDEKDNESEKEEKLSIVERVKNKTRKEIIEISKKRIDEKFKFKNDELLRYNLIQKLKELKPNNPYYYDFIFLIADLKKSL